MKTGCWMSEQEMQVELGKIIKTVNKPNLSDVDRDFLLRACGKMALEYYIKIKELTTFMEMMDK